MKRPRPAFYPRPPLQCFFSSQFFTPPDRAILGGIKWTLVFLRMTVISHFAGAVNIFHTAWAQRQKCGSRLTTLSRNKPASEWSKWFSQFCPLVISLLIWLKPICFQVNIAHQWLAPKKSHGQAVLINQLETPRDKSWRCGGGFWGKGWLERLLLLTKVLPTRV